MQGSGNYDPGQKACWLKTGRGFPKEESRYENFYTGHRDSEEECPPRLILPVYQQPAETSVPDERSASSNSDIVKETNNIGVRGKAVHNPCPDGDLQTNCEHRECTQCCTGEQEGTDGTPVCPADTEL